MRRATQGTLTTNTHACPEPTSTNTVTGRSNRPTHNPKAKKPYIKCRDMRSYFKATQITSVGAATKEGEVSNGIKMNNYSKSGIIDCSKPGSGDQMDRRGYIS